MSITLLLALLGVENFSQYLQPEKYLLIQGEKLHYRVRGKGFPLLLIHGFCASTFSWRYQLENLSWPYKAYALDLAGFGFSHKSAGTDYSTEAQGKRVLDFMKAMKISRANVVGHSMGGPVVSWLALHHPSRVKKLILVSSVPLDGKMSSEVARGSSGWNRLYRRFYFQVWKWILLNLVETPWLGKAVLKKIIHLNLRRMVNNPKQITPLMVEEYSRPLLDRCFVQAMFSMERKNIYRALDSGKIKQPTLLLWGENDRVVPLRVGKKLEKTIPNSRLMVFKDVGHLPAEEVSHDVNKEILKFLAKDTQHE